MINNSNKYISLRKSYQEFIYEGFDYILTDNDLAITYNFFVDDKYSFHPTLKFPTNEFYHFEKLPKQWLETLIFNIGMVELISYWKAMVPPKVVLKGYILNENQIAFWKKIYFHGLGEYFYLNGIEASYDDFLNIECRGKKELHPHAIQTSDSVIIPVGGGKDSVVSLEVLKRQSKDNLALIMNPRGASTATAVAGGFGGRILEVRRTLDAKLLELNAQGFLNGHTPFSALLAFITVLAAAATGRKYIALSNEGSANEPTVTGTKINHQYSKSMEFESDFRDYIRNNVTPDIQYFSLLRPLSELQIASVFAKNPIYFSQFKSCNVGSKTDIWCGKCPKCLFTFIILSPFLSPDKLIEIFGSNLLEDPELENYFDELTGVSEVKPFECIGTVDEVNAALCLARDKYTNLPYLLQRHKNHFGDDFCNKVNKQELLSLVSHEHFLEERFINFIMEALEN